jgi:hypothetical protein
LYREVGTAVKRASGELTVFTANCHRRFGKSHLGLLLAIERCMRLPGQQVKFGAPTALQAANIARPILQDILLQCPPDLRPRKSRDEWSFTNPAWGEGKAPSVLKIVGMDVDQGDRLRGLAADMVVLDEAGLVSNLEYIVDSILLYQFVGRTEPLLLLLSTPPRTMAHPFIQRFIPRSMERGCYSRITVDENADFTAKDEQLVLQVCGERESVSWRREALCECIADDNALVVPEFQAAREGIVREMKRPACFQPYTVLDAGYEDYTGVLFAYLDFQHQLPVVEDEIWVNHTTTGRLAAMIREKEYQLWHGNPRRVRRYGDLTEQQRQDLLQEHRMAFSMVQKYDRESAIARYRTDIGMNRTAIHPRCKHYINQLANGIHKLRVDGSRGDIERNELLGHCDLLMAGIYLHRSIAWHENPFPETAFHEATSWKGVGVEERTASGRIVDWKRAFSFGVN